MSNGSALDRDKKFRVGQKVFYRHGKYWYQGIYRGIASKEMWPYVHRVSFPKLHDNGWKVVVDDIHLKDKEVCARRP